MRMRFQTVIDAAHTYEWSIRFRGKFRGTITRNDITIEFVHDLYNHTEARAYRGDALTAIFTSQRDLAEYMSKPYEGKP